MPLKVTSNLVQPGDNISLQWYMHTNCLSKFSGLVSKPCFASVRKPGRPGNEARFSMCCFLCAASAVSESENNFILYRKGSYRR